MREEEFDKIIKGQVREQIQAPEELKNRIRTEIRNINVKPKRNMKVIQGIAAVFTVAILGVTTYAGVTGNLSLEKMGLLKASENYDENAVDINQTISNEYADIILKSIACDNAYIIEEYQINLKEKATQEFGEVEYDTRFGYKIDLYQNIQVNSQYADIMTTYVNKTGEREYQYFIVMNVMDIKEKKINLKAEIEELNLNDSTQYLVGIETEVPSSITINKKITLEIERSNTQVQQFEKIEKKIGNRTITIEEVANTNFETFIKVKEITENITWKEYNNKAMSYNSCMVTQANGEDLPYSIRYNQDTIWVTRDGKRIDSGLLLDGKIEDDEIIELEENFIINIGKTEQEVNKVAITPIKTTFLNDRTDEEAKQYYKAEWHKLENKKYSAKSSMGGTLEIENIEITDDEIIFYYNKTGNIGNEALILMRNNNGKYNYSYSSIEEEKEITGNENKIVFLRKDTGRVGCYDYDMTAEEFENLLDDISNLEFTMLFGSTTEKTGEAFEVEIPQLNKQTIKVKNVKITNIDLESDKE